MEVRNKQSNSITGGIIKMAKQEQNVAVEEKTTAVPEFIDNVEALEAKMKAMREAQKVFATFTQEQVDKIFYEAAMAANKAAYPACKDGCRGDTERMSWKIRSSRTTMQQSTFTMHIRTQRHAV